MNSVFYFCISLPDVARLCVQNEVNKKVKLCSSSLLFSWQNLTDTVKDQWKCVSHRLDYCDEMDARPNSVFLGVVGMFVLE